MKRERKLIWENKNGRVCVYKDYDQMRLCPTFSLEIRNNKSLRTVLILICLDRDIIESAVFLPEGTTYLHDYNLNSIWFKSKAILSAQTNKNYLDAAIDLSAHVHSNFICNYNF